MTSDSKDKNGEKKQEQEKEIDAHSGVETTGHEWDGIKELNNPAPRWWLWVFFITCIWAFGYWVVYPSWPTISGEGTRGGTTGNKGWTQYKQLQASQEDIIARKSSYLEKFRNASFAQIMNDGELYSFAIAGGRAAFKDNCATCHGTGGAGARGYPNLNDDDWLWGGKPEEIYHTIKYGIRSAHDDTHISQMPSFASTLSKGDISDIASYVLSLSAGGEVVSPPRGESLFSENCASCHGEDGRGDSSVGAPDLADSIWLHSSGDKNGIIAQINRPRHGMMPHWNERLDEQTIRQLAIYVHSLGGGE